MTDNTSPEILVVDDSLTIRMEIAKQLEKHGFKVGLAENGRKCMEYLSHKKPDIILLDNIMPELDGIEVCRMIKSDKQLKTIPVIFLTSANEVEAKVKGLKAGAEDYLTKPFEEAELIARIQTQLRTSNMLLQFKKEVSERKQTQKELLHNKKNLESLYQQLLKANDRLKELDLLKSMFIASMSHELRTPLNSIIGFSGLMLQGLSGTLSEEQIDNLKRIHKAGNHLLALISDVIDVSKIEAGRIEVFPEKFRIKDLVEEAVETIRPQADIKGLTLLVEADTWPVMHTDYKRLLQCLLNVIGNAVKYSEKGKITLSLSENMTDVEIRVQDTGIGIAREDLPRLFNAFERLESHLRVQAGGTGLGLYLTQKIVTELLQGAIWAESTLNVGSVFYLKIPTDLNMEPDK